MVIPKKFLVDAEEVDIRIEDNRIGLIPITQADSILPLKKNFYPFAFTENRQGDEFGF